MSQWVVGQCDGSVKVQCRCVEQSGNGAVSPSVEIHSPAASSECPSSAVWIITPADSSVECEMRALTPKAMSLPVANERRALASPAHLEASRDTGRVAFDSMVRQ